MRKVALLLLLAAAACQREEPREPVVRFATGSLGIAWDEMPDGLEARRTLAEKEASRGRALLEGSEPVLGVAHLRRAVDLHPASAELRRSLAAGFEKLGDTAAALRVVREGLGIAPRDPGLLYEVGRILYLAMNSEDAGELQEALGAWETLVKEAGATKEAEHAKQHLDELRRAAQLAASSAAKAPAAPAKAAAKKQARKAAPKAAPLAPRPAAPGSDNLLVGNELMERGEYAAAAKAYAAALEGGEDNDVRRLLGLARFRAGDRAGAVQAWEPLSRRGALDAETARLLREAREKGR